MMRKLLNLVPLLASVLVVASCTSMANRDTMQYFKQLLEQEKTAGRGSCTLNINTQGPVVVVSLSLRAHAQGLERGDQIVAVDDQRVSSVGDLNTVITTKKSGDRVQLTVVRKNREQHVQVECEDREQKAKAYMAMLEAAADGRWAECVSRTYELESLGPGPTSIVAYWRGRCADAERQAENRAPNPTDAQLLYEYTRRYLSEATVLPGGVEGVKNEVLRSSAVLDQWGYRTFAQDLISQLGQVDRTGTSGSEAESVTTAPAVQSVSAGTCFAVSPNGLILTAYHLIAGAQSITVRLTDGRTLDAAIEQAAVSADLALLRVNSSTGKFLPLAARRSARVGEPVFTLGFPAVSILGAEPKFTDGSISALSGPGGEAMFLQVSVPVQPGNSGGPLVNDEGEVVGVVTATAAIKPFLLETGGLPQNVNWAVKADYARPLFDAPNRATAVSNRQAAIDRTRGAVCFVEATTK